MQTKKMSLADMQGKLSRSEMKNIQGGIDPIDEGGPVCNTYWCTSNSDCVTQSCGNRCFSVSGKNRCTYL